MQILKCLQPPGRHHPKNEPYQRVRARREAVNKRLKQFRVIYATFRHDISFHGDYFHAVANITTLLLQDNPMFSI